MKTCRCLCILSNTSAYPAALKIDWEGKDLEHDKYLNWTQNIENEYPVYGRTQKKTIPCSADHPCIVNIVVSIKYMREPPGMAPISFIEHLKMCYLVLRLYQNCTRYAENTNEEHVQGRSQSAGTLILHGMPALICRMAW